MLPRWRKEPDISEHEEHLLPYLLFLLLSAFISSFFFLDPDPVTLCSRFPIPSFSFVMCHASHPAALPAEAQPWPRERFLQRTGYFRSPPHPSALVLFHLLKSPQQFVDDTEFRPPASDYSCAFDCQGSMSVVFRKI